MAHSQPHRIHRQFFDVELTGSEADGFALQKELPGLYRSWIMPALESVLDRLAPKEGLLVIDRLDLDVGIFEPTELEGKLSEAIQEALEKALREKVPADVQNALSEELSFQRESVQWKSPSSLLWEAFFHFLKSGRLPLSYKPSAESSLQEELLLSWEKNKPFKISTAVQREVLQVLSEEGARKRLVLQFSQEFQEILLSALLPASVLPVQSVLKILKDHKTPGLIFESFQKEASRQIWQAAFQQAASGKAARREFLVETLLSSQVVAQIEKEHPEELQALFEKLKPGFRLPPAREARQEKTDEPRHDLPHGRKQARGKDRGRDKRPSEPDEPPGKESAELKDLSPGKEHKHDRKKARGKEQTGKEQIYDPGQAEDQTKGPEPAQSKDQAKGPEPAQSKDQAKGPEPAQSKDQAKGPEPAQSKDQAKGPEPAQSKDQAKGPEPTRGKDQAKGPEPAQSKDQAKGPEPTRSKDQAKGPEPTGGIDQADAPGPTDGKDQAGASEPTHGKDQAAASEPTHGSDQVDNSDEARGNEQKRDSRQRTPDLPANEEQLSEEMNQELSEEDAQEPSQAWETRLRPEAKEPDQSFFKPRITDHDLGEGIYIDNAGIILLHPFLPQFFRALGVAQEDEIVEPDRALALLHYLATGQTGAPEYELVLPKVLCHIDLNTPVDPGVVLSASELAEATALLEAMIRHWDALRSTSPDGLRGTFLLRPGKLSIRENEWLLQVEPQGFDILLDQLPWGLGMIKLPWMKNMLLVEWR